MSDVIYLAPLCQEHERMWCEHDAPVDCECIDGPHPWIKYIAAPPKALTVTVVSAYEGSPMHTFKIDPTKKKTIVRPLHSLLGYVFEPEGDANGC